MVEQIMAELETTTSTEGETRPGEASRNAVDKVTDLLSGLMGATDVAAKSESKPEKKEEPEAYIDEDGEEVEGEETEPVEVDETNAGEGEVTWATTLGLDEKQVVLDDKGDFAGVNVKIDGKTSTVPLSDLVAGYQSNKSNTNKSKAIAEERKQLDSVKQQVLSEYGKKLKDAEALTEYLEDSMTKEYQGIDWNSLRYQNPAEYAALVQDYNIRTSEIEKIKAAIKTVVSDEAMKMNGEFQQNVASFVQAQVEKVIENNPQWTDKKILTKALTSMQTFCNETYGFSKEEFAEIRDARIIEVLKDAQRYRQGKQVASNKIEKKVAKFIKPTGSGVKTQSKLERLTKVAKETKGYAQKEAQRDAVAELFLNNS
jgi:CRISPR/Cas system CSM-associated protein Csm2 small subunit